MNKQIISAGDYSLWELRMKELDKIVIDIFAKKYKEELLRIDSEMFYGQDELIGSLKGENE